MRHREQSDLVPMKLDSFDTPHPLTGIKVSAALWGPEHDWPSRNQEGRLRRGEQGTP